jgi:hypothetical protein
MTILSVLMATTPEREPMFTPLYNELMRQVSYVNTFHPSLGSIEVVVDGSKRFLDGGLSIGKKRETLVQRATGKYLCFLDSDESIASNYLETIVRLCHRDADVVTFRSFAKLKAYWCLIDMGLHYPNDQANPNYTVRRSPWHVCPVRSYFAKLYSFSDINYGEDWLYFEQVLKHCTTEAKTESIIHSYQHGDHSEADKIVQSIERAELRT